MKPGEFTKLLCELCPPPSAEPSHDETVKYLSDYKRRWGVYPVWKDHPNCRQRFQRAINEIESGHQETE